MNWTEADEYGPGGMYESGPFTDDRREYVLVPGSKVAHIVDERGWPVCGRVWQGALPSPDDGGRRLCFWCFLRNLGRASVVGAA